KFQEARKFAFYRAILHKRTGDALDLAQQMGGTFEPDSYSLNSLVDAGHGAEVCEVLHSILEKTNNPSLWNTYIDVASRAGLTEPMMKLLDATLANPAVGGKLRNELEEARLNALLATDKINEAGALLSKQVAAASSADPADKAIRLARLGAALDHKEWFAQGLAAARKQLTKLLATTDSLWNAEDYAENISKLLLDADRGPEAEAVWLEVLAACITAQDNEQEGYSISTNTMPGVLCGLAGVYSATGRNADVLILANKAKNWSAGDLAKIYQRSCDVDKRRSDPLGVIIARALAATGQRDEAAKIIEEIIPFLRGDDSAYALLVELRGQAALPLLDKLAALDAFEERPLIWKAKLQLDAGKLDDAESTARKAISIDPSDGEEGPGDRMRVYAVLADILAAKGNTKDAELFRNVVASIRMSEQADVLYDLGLLQRAIKLYEDSLLRFADAYCIQSRLALRLAESGDWKGAEEHYRRAYELMPDSFGRVESHCFGCERAFAGIPQQSIAEKVFKNLAKEQPNKPQVHYLLGYLYDEQDRTAEAIPEFRKAVELDPDYLNAWKELADAPAAALTPEEHDRIAANLLRLDPFGRHYSLELDGAGNLAAIWTQYEKAAALVPRRPEKLYPLPASAQRLAELAEAAKTDSRLLYYLTRDDDDKDRSPGAVFSQQKFTENVGRLMNALVSRSSWNE
ncbi:MAG: tetratricopeptide repeat protein, partial [Chthoniobacterales bacterium]